MAGFWNDENTEQLKALVAEGISYSQIARQLGCATRNQPLCKANRLKLVHPHGNDSRKGGSQQRRAFIPQAPRAIVAKPKQELVQPTNLPALMLDSGLVTLETKTDRMCSYPMGEPGDKDFHYCGNEQKKSSPYCEHHHALCRVPAPKRVKIDHRGSKRA